MKMLKVLVFAFAALAAARSSGQVTIGFGTAAISSDSSGFTLSNRTSGNSSAIAQLFSVPTTATQLNDFRFFLRASDGDVKFTAYVAEWSGSTGAAGEVKWSSSLQTISAGSSYSAYTFETGGLLLDASKTYALILLADTSSTGYASVAATGTGVSGVTSGAESFRWWGALTYDSLTTNSLGSTYSGLGYWSTYSNPNPDFYFAAAFSAEGGTNSLSPLSSVPEPSIPGLALGLSGLAGYVAWRRKKAAQVSPVAA